VEHVPVFFRLQHRGVLWTRDVNELAAVVAAHLNPLGRFAQHLTQLGTEHLARIHVRDQFVDILPEEGLRTAGGEARERLIGQHDVPDLDVPRQRPDSRKADDAVDPEQNERPDVGIVGHLIRCKDVILAVSRQEDHALPLTHPDHDDVRRITERRLNAMQLHVGQTLHVVEAGSSDECDGDGFLHEIHDHLPVGTPLRRC